MESARQCSCRLTLAFYWVPPFPSESVYVLSVALAFSFMLLSCDVSWLRRRPLLFGPTLLGLYYGSEFIILTLDVSLSGLLCLLCALFFLWFFHILSIIQLNKRILLVLVWLSGTDFTVPDLVGAAFAKADHRTLGTAYSSGSCKLAAALPQKSVRTVFQLTASYYYYCWFILYCFFFLVYVMYWSLFVIKIYCHFSKYYSSWWLVSVQYEFFCAYFVTS
jgi:hypothetical protein